MTKFKGMAAFIAPMMAAAVAPVLTAGTITVGGAGSAWAVDECVPENLADPADTVVCTTASPGAPFATGITYTNSDGLTLELNDAAITVGNPGVNVTSSGAATGNISVIGSNFDTISTTANNAYGLFSRITNATSTATATAMLTAGDITTIGNG